MLPSQSHAPPYATNFNGEIRHSSIKTRLRWESHCFGCHGHCQVVRCACDGFIIKVKALEWYREAPGIFRTPSGFRETCKKDLEDGPEFCFTAGWAERKASPERKLNKELGTETSRCFISEFDHKKIVSEKARLNQRRVRKRRPNGFREVGCIGLWSHALRLPSHSRFMREKTVFQLLQCNQSRRPKAIRSKVLKHFGFPKHVPTVASESSFQLSFYIVLEVFLSSFIQI